MSSAKLSIIEGLIIIKEKIQQTMQDNADAISFKAAQGLEEAISEVYNLMSEVEDLL